MGKLTERERELEEECSNVHAQVDEHLERNERLARELEYVERERQEEAGKVTELQSQVHLAADSSVIPTATVKHET